MAGFFRQTAQRAQVSGSRLHSSAALPYAAARDMQGETSPWADGALSGPVAAAPPRTRISAPSASSPAPAAASHDVAAKPSPGKARRTAPVSKSKAKPTARPNVRAAKTTRTIVERVMSLAASASLHPSPTARPQPAAAAKPTTLPAMIAASPPAAVRKNKPLKPQTRLQRNADAKRSAASGRRQPAAAPEVHIHIGRVELTANTPAPAAAKRPAASERRPLSLDDYLQQRRSRRAGSP